MRGRGQYPSEIAEALSSHEDEDYLIVLKSSLIESGKVINKSELGTHISKNAVIIKTTDTSPRILTTDQ